ncbi:terminase small subunit [Escherichia coli]|uniref:terminase small subunit n=1 Tax=Escherichia coli TaxID=562 RepID=UPI0005F97887|nr:terminase small subunit [Escherichia coli]HDQ6507639.1 terminase small subunit [Escherichia coli O121:H19]EEQ7788318.1 terminase small subunit [Escherichia coli]EEQ8978665.1 terminase small subunit [Escherichia coli]EEW3873227.1 terminase small subunit [Escherichia coli]EFA0158507.1 terminase small subunit [Escherichia coli]
MLTTQKRKFALALMSGKNKTASAIAAGYSAKTARIKGSQLAKDPEMPPPAVISHGIEYMEDGLPDPVKAMGQILVENLIIDPKLALDAAWRLAQFTHHKKGDAGKKSAKGDAAKKAANRFAVPPPPRLVVNNQNEESG